MFQPARLLLRAERTSTAAAARDGEPLRSRGCAARASPPAERPARAGHTLSAGPSERGASRTPALACHCSA